jgi:hypothetical protein
MPEAFSPVTTKNGMSSLVAEKPAKSLASCSKFLEELEAGPHTVISRICRGVEPAIRLGDRLGFVGRKIVPEMFEVEAFPPLDQREGRFSMEVEVPEV